MLPPPPIFPPFPYTTLFRSCIPHRVGAALGDPGQERLCSERPGNGRARLKAISRNTTHKDSLRPLCSYDVRDSLRLEARSEEHTSELQSLRHLVCRLLLEQK